MLPSKQNLSTAPGTRVDWEWDISRPCREDENDHFNEGSKLVPLFSFPRKDSIAKSCLENRSHWKWQRNSSILYTSKARGSLASPSVSPVWGGSQPSKSVLWLDTRQLARSPTHISCEQSGGEEGTRFSPHGRYFGTWLNGLRCLLHTELLC